MADEKLVIFDRSSSMEGERYKNCEKVVRELEGHFELWWFGYSISKLPHQNSNFANVPPNCGTDITNMLNELFTFLSGKPRIDAVLLLTDGEDDYDEAAFTKQFSPIVESKRYVFMVYDICGTNVKPLQNIFQCKNITTSISAFNELIADFEKIKIENTAIKNNLNSNDKQLTKLSTNVTKLLDIHKEFEEKFYELNDTTNSFLQQTKENLEKKIAEINDHGNDLLEFITDCESFKDEHDVAQKKLVRLNENLKKIKEKQNKLAQSGISNKKTVTDNLTRIIKIEKEIGTQKEKIRELREKNISRTSILKTDSEKIDKILDDLTELS